MCFSFSRKARRREEKRKLSLFYLMKLGRKINVEKETVLPHPEGGSYHPEEDAYFEWGSGLGFAPQRELPIEVGVRRLHRWGKEDFNNGEGGE